MDREWAGFLTKEETEEMERIKGYVEYAIVMRKMEMSGEGLAEAVRRSFPCSCLCMEDEDADIGDYLETLEKGMDVGIRKLLSEICRFSCRHGLCQCLYHQAARAVEKWEEDRKGEEERRLAGLADEELPF